MFVLQGSKYGILEGEIYLYDEDHYLAVSVPVPFRMTSTASARRPLLAVYLEFDMQMAAGIASQLEKLAGPARVKPKGLFSSRMDSSIEDVLLRLLTVLGSPVEIAVLGDSILRELHYRSCQAARRRSDRRPAAERDVRKPGREPGMAAQKLRL